MSRYMFSGSRSVEQSNLKCIFVCKLSSRRSGSAVPETPTKRCLHPQGEPAGMMLAACTGSEKITANVQKYRWLCGCF